MKNLVMSNLYPRFCEELSGFGYNIIPSRKINVFHKPEQYHADMQILKIGNKLFTLESCKKLPEKNYPGNILLNCLYLNNRLYGKLDCIDETVLQYCAENGIETVNVNQGYARCSSLVTGKNAVITADKSMKKALKINGAEVLLISPGNIVLEGFDYGFIGGASFYDNNTVFFFGDVTKHPDYQKIRSFTEENNSKIEILCKSQPLTDIGGAVIV